MVGVAGVVATVDVVLGSAGVVVDVRRTVGPQHCFHTQAEQPTPRAPILQSAADSQPDPGTAVSQTEGYKSRWQSCPTTVGGTPFGSTIKP